MADYSARTTQLTALVIAVESLQRNATSTLKTLLDKDTQLEKEIVVTDEAIRLCKICLEEQSKVKLYIESLATNFLNAVIGALHTTESDLPSKLEFILEPVIKDGITVGLKPLVGENGDFDSPLEFGVGVSNLVSFAIRLVFILLNPELSQVIVGDEMLVNLHPMVWTYLLRFIEDLQKTLPLQLVLITHAGIDFPNTVRVYKKGGTSYVEVLS